ncbi:Anti-sigma-E factor ChrR [BD1-7 clade bacterium]|uniref:Anti-sigma-E factor ChrR n=1 Tax=BD1-7 clade bacterium TaxID=2029982 RepID=A0A5S9PNP9_9GAMM|nr:Anti-sigma-E factor ChrR [BD1-7 clade bacterium]CAA0105553.1 Anti-sigma-E factor ChrR [BD1-7 clade bacterium]
MTSNDNSMKSDSNNHPSIEHLVEYSAGSMALSRAMCISAHVEHCSHCRNTIRNLNAIGSEQLRDIEPAGVSASLKDRVMGKIQRDAQSKADVVNLAGSGSDGEPSEKRSFTMPSFVPRCITQFFDNDYDDMAWTRVSPSVRMTALCTDTNGAKVALVRIKPGGRMAHHSHIGEEVTVVLHGAFSDEDGMYQAGDFVFRDADHKHTPVATKDSECVCLITLDAPIQFTGFFTRWLNPLLRRNHPLPA